MSPLYQMRDLVKKLLEVPASGVRVGPAYGQAVDKSLEHVFSSGMELCLQSVLQKTVAVNDLKIAMEIFYLMLPRAPDMPKQCRTCEFDDFNDEAFATFDLEGAIAGYATTPGPVWTVKECKDKVIQLITRNLRGVLQQLVLNYPLSTAPAFDELFAVELLGMMISTCGDQSFWSNVMSTVLKNRNVVSRVLSAALKYNSEKEWLGRVFLRERGSDQELIIAWLVGTLDVRSLNSEPIPFQVGDVPFAIRDSRMSPVTDTNPTTFSSIRYSDSWVMLSDGIIYQMLREQPVGLCNVDRQLLQILHDVASTCKFPAEVSANDGKLHEASKLYDLHLDMFQSFCRSAGSIWRSYVVAPVENWDELNKFRAKMVNPQFGIFVSFLE
uniref:Uncharacterized protein n=1 Tax=Hyaloperonospora arabidopsidis (strain Emoy2) TaxID=559515 RepID=M4BCB0_HYAAE